MHRAAAALGLLLLVVGCGNSADDNTGTVTVFAASSLTEAFTEIAAAFEVAHPGSSVVLSFGASTALASQILEGAPADVFASADEENLDRLVIAGESEPGAVFARNRLAILVAPGNPHAVTGLAGLAQEGLIVVLCDPAVPCGRYSQEALDAAGAELNPASYEDSVKAVVQKVVLGEADAGIVYETDVIAAGETATGIAIPDAFNVLARYPIAALTAATNPVGAADFVAFVAGDEAQQILRDHGFLEP